jgi:hypothetical protein
MAVAFDTLQYARRLREAGISQEQAEAHAIALAGLIGESLATKDDPAKPTTAEAVDALRRALEDQAVQLRAELRAEITELEHRLTVRFGAMLGLSVGVLAAIVKLV